MTPLVRYGLGAVVGLVAGVGVGTRFHPWSPPEVFAPATVRDQGTVTGGDPGCGERVTAAQRGVASACRSWREEQLLHPPVPFPDQLPAALRPDTVEDLVVDLEERCQNARSIVLDCDEFPCGLAVATPPGEPCDLGALSFRSKVKIRSDADGTILSLRILPSEWDEDSRAAIDARWDYREHVLVDLASNVDAR